MCRCEVIRFWSCLGLMGSLHGKNRRATWCNFILIPSHTFLLFLSYFIHSVPTPHWFLKTVRSHALKSLKALKKEPEISRRLPLDFLGEFFPYGGTSNCMRALHKSNYQMLPKTLGLWDFLSFIAPRAYKQLDKTW